MVVEQPSLLVMLIGLVLAGVIPFSFLLGFRQGIAALILIRPLCDRIFEAGRFDVGGHALSYGALINLVVICIMALYIGQTWRDVPDGLRTLWLPFLLMAFVAVLYSPVQIDAFRKFVTYSTFAGMFMFAFVVAKSDRDAVYLLKLVILSSLLPVLYGLFQTLSGIDWYAESRIQATFSHPNIFAFYLLAIIGAILFLLATDRGRMGRHLRTALSIYLAPLFVLLIMTKTRSAWAGCLMLLFVYGLVYDKRALLIVLAAPLVAFAVPAISDRILDLASRNDYIGGTAGANVNAYAWRQMLWQNASVYIWQKPIFGYGLDSFHFYSPLFFPLTPKGTEAHNVYIQILFEEGLIGLFSFLWIFLKSSTWLVRFRRVDRRGLITAGGILGVYFLFCYSDNILEYLSFNWCFWLSCGAMYRRLEQTNGGIVRIPKHSGRQLRRLGARNAGKTRSSLAS